MSRQDLYPSRNGSEAKLAERVDPVVYCDDKKSDLISEAQVKQYEEQGFLVLDNVFSTAEVAFLKQELDRLRHDDGIKGSDHTITEPQSREVRSIFKVHEISPVFEKLAADVRLAGVARHLLGDDVYMHQSRLNYKPPFRGKEFYWHSDFETWHVEDGMPRMRALSMSITLTNNFDCNGPLMLIPGSHRWYVVCEGETPEDHFKESLKKQEYGVPSDDNLAKLAEPTGITTATSNPGSVIIFDCNTMHGSNSNISPYARSNAFFVYNAMSNRVEAPFCDQKPRPEYICSRETIRPITPRSLEFANEA